jgi:hypothetical protein
MRKIDRRENLKNANILAEQRYLESKGLISEEHITVKNMKFVSLVS